MSNQHSNQDTNSGAVSRRDFLAAGALSMSLAGVQAAPVTRDTRCIFLCLVGGPSQLDTWDLKPDAPSGVRGPFRPIRTCVPGLEISEHFPLMAQQANRYAILRGLHHTAAPIHETGQQLMQTGHVFRAGLEYPHFGATLSHLRGSRMANLPASVVLPGPIGNTGVSISHGQGAGYLDAVHAPQVLDLRSLQTSEEHRYGKNPFGRSCLLARQLVEKGVHCVTVNMFHSVFDEITWDCHADSASLPTTLRDYATTLCPMFDRAYSTLLGDLADRGLLDSTLVVATGEFGRTPHLNPRGGRDHWPGVWSMLLAGAGIRGGQVLGASDRLGGEPRDRPTTPAEVAATVYHALGIDPATQLPGPDGQAMRLVEARPVLELF